MRVVWVVEGGVHPSGTLDVVPLLVDLVRAMSLHVELKIVAVEQLPKPGRFTLHGVDVRDLSLRSNGFRRLLAPWSLRGLNADVVHTFGLGLPTRLGALVARGGPLVASVWGGEQVWLPTIGYGGARTVAQRSLMATALRLATKVTAPSVFAADSVREWRPDTVVQPLFGNLGASPGAVERHDGPARLLTVGSPTAVKGPEVMLAALERVRRVLPATLTWVGRPHGFSAPGVDFTGERPNVTLANAYREATMYVQASWHESEGIAVTEAAGFGCPLVGTAVGLIPELAPNAAISVPPGDSVALAEHIVALLQDPARRDRLGAAARAWRCGRDAEWTAKRLLELYEAAA